MSIRLEILYNCVVKEEVFLGNGWGIRDVRGPYLIGNPAQVLLPREMLNKKFTTQVSFHFGLSSRSPHEGVEVSCHYKETRLTETILRNNKCNITFKEVFSDNNEIATFEIYATQLITSGSIEIVPIYDCVALDKLVLERNLSPIVRY